MKKFEVGVVVTVMLSIITFAFWLGSLTNQISDLRGDKYFIDKKNRATKDFSDQIKDIYGSYNLDGIKNILPTGTILAFGGTGEAIPKGWFPCDGRVLQVSEYKELYLVVKNSFGGEPGAYFNLPDLRGRFLRGVDHNSSRDPDAGNRISSAKGGNTGDQVGSLQLDATSLPKNNFETDIKDPHSHGYRDVYWMEINGSVSVGSHMGDSGGDSDNNGFEFSRTTALDGKHGHLITSGGDNETRPTNVNIEWIIKVK